MRSLAGLCLFLVACGNAGAAGARLQLALKESVAVEGQRVTLASVLEPSSTGQAALRTLLASDLGATPLPGYALRLGREDIARRVRMRDPGAEFDWSGADAVRVERLSSAYDGAALVSAAEVHLRAHLEPLGLRLELRPAQRAPDLQLPRGAVELKPRPLPGARAVRPNMTVWLDILVDGVVSRAVAVLFRVAAFGPVLVSKRELGAGTRPACPDLDVLEVDVAALDGTPVAPDCTLAVGQLKHRLGPGMPLLGSHLLQPAAVAQGDQVTLRLDQGVIALETRAVALMNGEVGQSVDVRTTSSKQSIRAEVIAPGVVALTKR